MENNENKPLRVIKRVTRSGDSLVIALPKLLLQESGINYGDKIYLEVFNGRISIEKVNENFSGNQLSTTGGENK